MAGPLSSILVCGQGLAFEMCLAALSNNLPEAISISALEIAGQTDHDAFYGNVTSPLAFGFLTSLGLDEPGLLRNTNTSFSYGTRYKNWAGDLFWIQAHHLPFPVWNNVQFLQYLAKLGKPLEPYLVSAVAGKAGVFAHPPQDPNIPLSRAEYGYQIRPRELAEYLKKQAKPKNVTRIAGDIKRVRTKNRKITSIELNDGRNFSADLFVDAAGVHGRLVSSLKNTFLAERELGVLEYIVKSDTPAGSVRELEGHDFGWRSVTHLQDQQSVLTVYHPDDFEKATTGRAGELQSEFKIPLGKRHQGWIGNCVGIGQANCVIEPLTPAPMMLLQLDIQRLLSLIPVSENTEVEEREFNRFLANDIEHCELFNAAFFHIQRNPDTPYWQDAVSSAPAEKLKRKIEQFESRGHLTMFDHEPFNEQDWSILHFGLGRVPKRHDPFADNTSESAIGSRLDQLKRSIKQIVKKMPPHKQYLEKFLDYLERKHGR